MKVRIESYGSMANEADVAAVREAVGSRRCLLVTQRRRAGSMIARDASYNLVVLPEDLPPGTKAEAQVVRARATGMIGVRPMSWVKASPKPRDRDGLLSDADRLIDKKS